MTAQKCPQCQADLAETAEGECIPCLLRAGGQADPDFLIQEKLRYFADYELKEVLGRGGMGIVFRAWQVSRRREVALKMINSGELASAEAVRRFRREAEAASLLQHPNIIKIYAVGEHEGNQFIAMELSHGEDLSARRGQFKGEPRLACSIVAQIARAVYFAHQHGILHRDLKPSNILLDDRNVPLLTDFGLAKISRPDRTSSANLTHPGRLIGTPEYMAPEQFDENVQQLTTTAEVFSLGVILYELLAGRLPYAAGNSVELLRKVQANEVVPLRTAARGIPRPLHNICAKALHKEPKARYQSAEELAEDLERWLDGGPVLAKPESAPEALFHWAARNRVAICVIGVFLCAFVVSTALLVRLREQSAHVDNLMDAERRDIQADLDNLWRDPNLPYQKITSERLSILTGLEDSGSRSSVRYSVGAYENNGQLAKTVHAYAPIFKHLEKALMTRGRPSPRFDLLLCKFNPTARTAFAEGRFDIGRFGATPYNLLREKLSDIVVIAAENSEHVGVVFVRQDSPKLTLAELRGGSIALGERSSTTSGTFAPAYLVDHGLRAADFKRVKWHAVNGAAVQAVSRGEFDAGVSGRDTYLKSGATNLVIIASFESQRAVWVARKSLGEPFIAELREAFLSCPREDASKLIGTDARPFDAPQPIEMAPQTVVYQKRDAFFAGWTNEGQ